MKRAFATVLLALGLASARAATPFTPGNVVVLQCAGTSSGGNAGALLEYTPTGTLVQTIPLDGMVFGNTITLTHDISLSADGAQVIIPGYTMLAASIETTTAVADNRVMASVKWDGTVSYYTNSAFANAASVRGATGDGFGNFWGIITGGTRWLTVTNPTASPSINGTGSRGGAIFNGQLYVSTGSTVNSVGSGLPTTSTPYSAYLSGVPNANVYGFALPPGTPTTGSTAYVGDYSGTPTAIFAYTWNSVWSLGHTLTFSGIGNPDHIAVDYNHTPPAIYFTTASGANNSLYAITDPGADGTYTPTTLATTSGGAILRGVAMAPVQPAAPICSTPPTDVTINPGDTALFGPVDATGANPYAYTWKADYGSGKITLTNGPTGHGSSVIGGATTATLGISNVASGDLGSYYVEANNNGGSAECGPGVLHFFPTCLTTNLVSITNVAGSTASFTVAGGTAGCTPTLTYNWFRNGGFLSDGPTGSGSVIAGSSTDTLTISGVQDGDADGSPGAPGTAGSVATYSLIVYDMNFTPNISSALLTLLDPPFINTEPADANKSAGQNATFTVAATGGSLYCQWYKNVSTALSDGATGSGSTISGSHAASLTITGVQDADAASYSVTVTNLAGTASSTPPAVLTVGHAPAITTQPTNTTAVVGANASFTVVASGSPTLTYVWKHNGTALSDGGQPSGSTIAGSSTDTLMITGVQAGDANSYSVVVSGPYSPAATSSTAFLTVVTAACQPNIVPGQIIYDPFNYPTGPYPATVAYSWDHVSSVCNQETGERAYWTALGGLNSAVQANDLVNYVNVNRIPPGEYPWPGVDCSSVNLWYWSSAANNNHLRFGGVPQTDGAAYFSCLFHVDQGAALSQGTFDVIGGFTSDSTADSWNYKLCTQVSNGGDAYWLGIFKGGGSGVSSGSLNGQWDLADSLARGQLHFLVGCYKFGSGTNLVGGSITNDDTIALWIDPDRSTFGASEANLPAATLGGMVTNWANNAPIIDFGLKGTVAPASKRMTELRIGKTWASVTAPYYPKLKIATSPTDVTVSWPAKDTPFDSANGQYRGYLLQSAAGLTGWANDGTSMALDGTGTNYTVTEPLNAPQFFRLIEPAR